MSRKLKVYGVNLDGRQRGIVAATSQKSARDLFDAHGYRMSLNHLRDYGGETGNALEIEIALAAPGTVFATKYALPRPEYRALNLRAASPTSEASE